MFPDIPPPRRVLSASELRIGTRRTKPSTAPIGRRYVPPGSAYRVRPGRSLRRLPWRGWAVGQSASTCAGRVSTVASTWSSIGTNWPWSLRLAVTLVPTINWCSASIATWVVVPLREAFRTRLHDSASRGP